MVASSLVWGSQASGASRCGDRLAAEFGFELLVEYLGQAYRFRTMGQRARREWRCGQGRIEIARLIAVIIGSEPIDRLFTVDRPGFAGIKAGKKGQHFISGRVSIVGSFVECRGFVRIERRVGTLRITSSQRALHGP